MALPLSGIKVVDFSEHGFVPSSAAALADFGADVIKIERLDGDAMRGIIKMGMVPTVDNYDYLFQLVNRNKRGIALEVESPEGRAVFERLIKWADVYITNQLPRVRRKLKTEPEDIMAINPKIVFAKGHGQGQRGADSEAGGFDGVSYWARGGVSGALTPADAVAPVAQRPALGDIPTGMFLAGGICAALVGAMRTGKGVVVDTSLLNGAIWALGPDMAYASLAGTMMNMGGKRIMSPVTSQYKTKDGRFVSLMMIDEGRYWDQACRAVGLPELIEQYPDPESRRAAWEPMIQIFADRISLMTRKEFEERLRAENCIFSFFATPDEVLEDQAVIDNGYVMSYPGHPKLRLSAAPAQFDNEMPQVRRAAPDLGENTLEVLNEIGYSEAEIQTLLSNKVVIAKGK